MKKYVLVFSFLIFLLILKGVTVSVYAANTGVEKQQGTTKITETVTIEYMLPFPGILPDHPLYFFKTLRDMIIEKMITNDIKKAEFYILQADKRLQMSVVFAASQKNALSETMRNDAFVYREKALTTLVTALEKKVVIPRYVFEKLLVSTQKHEEVLTSMNVEVTALKALVVKIETMIASQTDEK